MVAFLRTLPPVDRQIPESAFGPLGRFALLTNQLPFFSAALIDHSVRAPKSVTPEVSVAYGAYMIAPCMGCHGSNLAGGPVPASAPGDPLGRQSNAQWRSGRLDLRRLHHYPPHRRHAGR